jgi:hypothetical protein
MDLQEKIKRTKLSFQDTNVCVFPTGWTLVPGRLTWVISPGEADVQQDQEDSEQGISGPVHLNPRKEREPGKSKRQSHSAAVTAGLDGLLAPRLKASA